MDQPAQARTPRPLPKPQRHLRLTMTTNAHHPLTVLADENIAGLDDYFACHQNVKLIQINGRAITDSLWQYRPDALFIRSVTPINEDTLPATACQNLRFVGTATIGTDHIDQSHLAKQNIAFASAQGSSKHSVAQYVIAAILTLRPELLSQKNPTLGIVGLGNIGGALAFYAKQLGFGVRGFDPLLPKGGDNNACFDEVLTSDVISVHTPLTHQGASNYPTYHLFDTQAFNKTNPNALFINTARGQVVSENALLDWLAYPNALAVLDVYEYEPFVSAHLLSRLAIATPHIAGYTLEGKWCGTDRIYRAFCRYFGLMAQHRLEQFLPDNPYRFGDLLAAVKQGDTKKVRAFYDIKADDTRLRSSACQSGITKETFDNLRKSYPLRRQWLP